MVARLLDRAVGAAVSDPSRAEGAEAALAVLEVSRDLGLTLDLERAQELVHDALSSGSPAAALRRLAEALHLTV